MKIPSPPLRGDSVSAKIGEIINFLRYSNVTSVVGGRIIKTPNGSTLFCNSGKGGATSISPEGYVPWQPQFFTTGTDPSIVYKCTINLGTVNGVAATNWDSEFTLPSDDTVKFIVITITAASGKVTGVSISIDTSPPATDYIAKDTPPVTHKLVLGAIDKTSARMIVATNLQESATEVFRETKNAPATGEEPFSRWWRWEVV